MPPDDALRNARMADLSSRPSSRGASEFEGELVSLILGLEVRFPGCSADGKERQRPRGKQGLRKLGATVSAFVADLIRHSANVEAHGYCYRAADSRTFVDAHATYREWVRVVALWERHGFLEKRTGFKARKEWEGQPIEAGATQLASRYRATPRLLAMAQRHGINPDTLPDHYRQDFRGPVVIVREASTIGPRGQKVAGKTMKVSSSVRHAELTAEMTRLNAFVTGHDFRGMEAPWFRRIFSNGNQPGFSYDQGGRVYAVGSSCYQRLSGEVRRHITINGAPTVEIDLRASQLSIGYGLLNCGLPADDPYTIEGFPRDVVKAVTTALMGRDEGVPRRWPKDFAEGYLAQNGRKVGADYALKDVVAAICERHPVIMELKDQGWTCHHLQYVESEILMNTMLTLADVYSVPCLPVFDSLIVRASDRPVTERVLSLIFKERTGFVPRLK